MSEGESGGNDIGRTLLQIARSILEHAFDLGPEPEPPKDPRFKDPGACFVTLKEGGELRGCIGSPVAYRSLWEDLRENTLAAAFRDPRFSPLTREDLPRSSLEVSLLQPLQEMTFRDEQDVLRQLRSNVDGILLECGPNKGLFLPSVWTGLPEPQRFLRKLKRKAGLPEDFWSSGVRLWRFTVSSWEE